MRRTMAFGTAAGLALALMTTACTTRAGDTPTAQEVGSAQGCDRPRPTVTVDDEALHEALREVAEGGYQADAAYAAAAQLGDVRAVPVLLDVLRVLQFQPEGDRLVGELERLTGCDLGVEWVAWQRWALARDVPAPPRYQEYKRELLGQIDTAYQDFLAGPVDLDLREVAWGGVGVDGIVPLVDPPSTSAQDASDLDEASPVFGLEVGGQARAYSRQLLVEHELVNDILGGLPVALPYCSLCGTATAYLTDVSGQRLVMGTSGLLDRSNKLMYDRETGSLWGSFDGAAVAGPLRDTVLRPLPVTITTWAEWRTAHPATTVVVAPPGLDDDEPQLENGDPLFPVPPVDARLPALTEVLGVEHGPRAVAFPLDDARRRAPFMQNGIRVQVEAGALVARTADGELLPSRQSLWFAWSQFRPGTQVVQVR